VFAFDSRITDNLTRLPAIVRRLGVLRANHTACHQAIAVRFGNGQLLSRANASGEEKFQLLSITGLSAS
jgi:hypothetical protein